MWNIWEFRYNVQVDRVVEYITLREGIRKKNKKRRKERREEGEMGGWKDGRRESEKQGSRRQVSCYVPHKLFQEMIHIFMGILLARG